VRFSVYLDPRPARAEQAAELIEAGIEQVLRLTEAGFAGVVLPERLPGRNAYGDSITMAAHLAGVVRPGTRFFLPAVDPALHDPARLALQLDLLDVVAGGNVAVGTAPADPPPAPAAWCEPGAALTDEAARAAGAGGRHLFADRVRPPQLADRLRAYEAGLRASGLGAAAIEERLEWSFCLRRVVVRDSDREARDEALRRIELVERHARPLYAVASAAPADDAEALVETAFAAGSPVTVAAELQRCAEAGIRHLALCFDAGFMTAAETAEAIGRFQDEVLPRFRGTPACALAAPTDGRYDSSQSDSSIRL
jgi:alkanesulfonate monooxygenase SsuD/methylene tetrahydromethanopterin reductase-like flavin-dependent oxidoreductase (luciferase family)